MKCQVKFVSYYAHPSDSTAAMHRHDCYEIVYYLSGTGSTVINGVRYAYNPDYMAIIEPGCDHDEYRQTALQVLFIGLDYEAPDIRLANGVYPDGEARPVRQLMQQIRQEMRDHRRFYERRMDLLAGEVLIELARLDSGEQRQPGGLAYAVHYLDENCSQPADLVALAELTGYSYHRFRHLFKEKTGQSPTNYLIGRRLARAQELLRQTDLPLARIAQDCGFYNESQLSTIFKQAFNQSPGRFRRVGPGQ